MSVAHLKTRTLEDAMLLPALPVLVVCCVLAGCDQPAVPVEFSKACAVEYEKKQVEMRGFLSARGSVFCSNRSGRMECGITFTETPGAQKSISAYIEQGSGANNVEKLKSGYKREDVKIHDNHGKIISLAEKVKLTGKLNVTPDLSTCFVDVAKIETQ